MLLASVWQSKRESKYPITSPTMLFLFLLAPSSSPSLARSLSLSLSPCFHFPLPTSLQRAPLSLLQLQVVLMSFGNSLSSYQYGTFGSTMCHEVSGSGLCGVDRCVGQSCDHTQKAGRRIWWRRESKWWFQTRIYEIRTILGTFPPHWRVASECRPPTTKSRWFIFCVNRIAIQNVWDTEIVLETDGSKKAPHLWTASGTLIPECSVALCSRSIKLEEGFINNRLQVSHDMPTTTWNRNPDSKSWSIESEPSCADHGTSFLAKHGHVRPMTGSRRDLSTTCFWRRRFLYLVKSSPLLLALSNWKGVDHGISMRLNSGRGFRSECGSIVEAVLPVAGSSRWWQCTFGDAHSSAILFDSCSPHIKGQSKNQNSTQDTVPSGAQTISFRGPHARRIFKLSTKQARSSKYQNSIRWCLKDRSLSFVLKIDVVQCCSTHIKQASRGVVCDSLRIS